MNKETNSKIIAAHKKIKKLQEKLDNAIKEKNKLVQDSYCEDIKGKFIRIIHKDGNFNKSEFSKEYINVEDIYIDNNDNITYLGKGFKYEDGEFIGDTLAAYSEMYQETATCLELNNGNVKVIKVTKEEFETELSNMLEFIKENGKQYREIKKMQQSEK